MEADEMNRIRFSRLILSGLVTFLVFIFVEFLLEFAFFGSLFGLRRHLQELDLASTWRLSNYALNILIALVNSIMLIWMYAALRPMFGVGPKTALIATAFVYTFIFSMMINFANLRFYPLRPALIELAYQFIELPVAILAGAYCYEGGWEETDQPVTTS
jgi:hypothetical protein